jgi:methylmalonyl-CoA mutase cobalamin-binding subunit
VFLLAAVGKKVRVALVCGETEGVSDLLRRLHEALGKAAKEKIMIDEVLPEICAYSSDGG